MALKISNHDITAPEKTEELDYDALMEELNSDPQYAADMEAKRQEDLLYQMNTELLQG